jgi:hypothetical protein
VRGAGTWGRVIAAGSVLAIAGLTLSPLPHAAAAAARTPLLCLVCGDHGGMDVILNVILFLPLGFGLRLAGASIRRATLGAALLSFTVELLQYTVVVGRDASLSDLLTNTLGGLLGAILVDRVPLLVMPPRRAATRLFAAGILAWLGLLALSGWLLAPDFGNGNLFSVTGAYGAPQAFTGRVLEVRRHGRPEPWLGVPPDGEALRAELREGRVEVEARVVTGPEARGRRWIYAVLEGVEPRWDLSEDRRDVLLGVPARAQRFRLGTPSVMLPRGLPADTGRVAALRAVERNRTLQVTSTYDGTTRSVTLSLNPVLGWTLLAPFDLGAGPQVRTVTVLMLLLAGLVLGRWARWSERPRLAGAALAAAIGLGLGAIPLLQGYPPVQWAEWLAALAGAAAGWARSPAEAYLERRCGSPSTAESFSS